MYFRYTLLLLFDFARRHIEGEFHLRKTGGIPYVRTKQTKYYTKES